MLFRSPDGDTYHRPYSSRVGTGTYTRNQTSAGVSPTAITATDESLSVDTAKFASFEIDRLDEKQSMYNLQNDLKEDAKYQLADLVDTAILRNMQMLVQMSMAETFPVVQMVNLFC